MPFGCSVILFLIPAKMMPLALSTAPLDCEWYTEAKHSLVPRREQNYLNEEQSNCLPLSMIVISFGTPNRHTIFCQKNFCRDAAVMSRSALA